MRETFSQSKQSLFSSFFQKDFVSPRKSFWAFSISTKDGFETNSVDRDKANLLWANEASIHPCSGRMAQSSNLFFNQRNSTMKEPVQTWIGCHDINITITAAVKKLLAWRQRQKTLLRLRLFVIFALFERHSCFTAVIVLGKYLSPALNLISLEFQAEFTFSIHPTASPWSWHRIASHLSMFIAQAKSPNRGGRRVEDISFEFAGECTFGDTYLRR